MNARQRHAVNVLILSLSSRLPCTTLQLLRGSGCIINDIIDMNLDKKVARTATRPLASGELKPFDVRELSYTHISMR